MKCPKCQSDNTRRYSMVWEEGLSTSETTEEVSSSGTGYGGGSNFDFDSSGSGSSKTTTQTALSKKCNPPSKESLVGAWLMMVLLGAIVGFVLWLIFSREGSSFWTFVLTVTILGAILGVKSAGTARTFNREKYPKLRGEWENKWLCMKCGESYVQG